MFPVITYGFNYVFDFTSKWSRDVLSSNDGSRTSTSSIAQYICAINLQFNVLNKPTLFLLITFTWVILFSHRRWHWFALSMNTNELQWSGVNIAYPLYGKQNIFLSPLIFDSLWPLFFFGFREVPVYKIPHNPLGEKYEAPPLEVCPLWPRVFPFMHYKIHLCHQELWLINPEWLKRRAIKPRTVVSGNHRPTPSS